MSGDFYRFTPAFWAADKGQPRTESDRDIKVQQSYTVSSRRIDFQQVARVAASGEQSVAVGYNLAS